MTSAIEYLETQCTEDEKATLQFRYGEYVKQMVKDELHPLDPEAWLQLQGVGPKPHVYTAEERIEINLKFRELTQELKVFAPKEKKQKKETPKELKTLRAFKAIMVEAGFGGTVERASWLLRGI